MIELYISIGCKNDMTNHSWGLNIHQYIAQIKSIYYVSCRMDIQHTEREYTLLFYFLNLRKIPSSNTYSKFDLKSETTN